MKKKGQMKSDIIRRIAAALIGATTTTAPLDLEGTEIPDFTKYNNIPITYPINNRHERRKQKAMKRKKK